MDKCPDCGGDLKCLGGHSAHPLNWYCENEYSCGWKAWMRRKTKSTITYRCHLKPSCINLEYVDSLRGIQAFKDGFWIDEKHELTCDNDAKYWIPPGTIKYVEKIK